MSFFADKNSFLPSKVIRSHFALVCILAMLVGFFVSRAMLSIAMILFGINALIDVHPQKWLKERWWLLGVAWVGLYAVSWFWSNDLEYWNTRLQVKLPIILLPLAFAFTPAFSYRQLKLFTIILCGVLLYAVCYSLYFFVQDPAHYIEGYNFSKVIPTLPKNDHIRFSSAIASGIVWCVFFFSYLRERWMKWFVAVTVIVLSIYLHILAARTGLIAWYVFIAIWTIYLVVKRNTRWLGIAVMLLIIVAASLAFKYIPTLKERVGYFRYTLIVFKQGELTGNYSDMGRVISYDIALKLMKQHPLKGVGAGNILDTMKKGYDAWYPQVNEEQRLIPHNQFLTVGVACGIPALILFVVWVIYPVFQIKRNRAGLFFAIAWLMSLIPLMTEPVLEVQFGVFVYLFFLLWQRHAMIAGNQELTRAKNA